MKAGIVETEVKKNMTVSELLDELQLSSAPILLEIDGEVFYPDQIKARALKKGEKLSIIPLIAGG